MGGSQKIAVNIWRIKSNHCNSGFSCSVSSFSATGVLWVENGKRELWDLFRQKRSHETWKSHGNKKETFIFQIVTFALQHVIFRQCTNNIELEQYNIFACSTFVNVWISLVLFTNQEKTYQKCVAENFSGRQDPDPVNQNSQDSVGLLPSLTFPIYRCRRPINPTVTTIGGGAASFFFGNMSTDGWF